MGAFSLWHWLIMLIILGVFILPGWVIASKTGRSGALGLLNLIPGIGTLIFMAVIAFGKWPAVDEEE